MKTNKNNEARNEARAILDGAMNPSRAWRVSELANANNDAEIDFAAAEAHSRMAKLFCRDGNEFEAAKHMACHRAHIHAAVRYAAK
jgi:hypothetical protein